MLLLLPLSGLGVISILVYTPCSLAPPISQHESYVKQVGLNKLNTVTDDFKCFASLRDT